MIRERASERVGLQTRIGPARYRDGSPVERARLTNRAVGGAPLNRLHRPGPRSTNIYGGRGELVNTARCDRVTAGSIPVDHPRCRYRSVVGHGPCKSGTVVRFRLTGSRWTANSACCCQSENVFRSRRPVRVRTREPCRPRWNPWDSLAVSRGLGAWL